MEVGLVLWVLSSLLAPALSDFIVSEFSPSEQTSLHNLAMDNVTGELYVGATNYVYKLGADLSLRGTVVTGPRNDNLQCPPDPSESCCGGSGGGGCGVVRRPTDAINKLVAIDRRSDTLVACSTLYYGSCERISMRNFASLSQVFRTVVSNDPGVADVGFVGDAMTQAGALYVATTRSSVGESTYRQDLPMLATISVNTLEYVKPWSRLSMVRPKYVYFRHGFQYQGYNYFLTVQDTPGSQINMTTIVRFCQNDEYYRSYMETPMECTHNNVVYNNMASATVAQFGSSLAESLGYRDTDSVLFAAFTKDGRSQSAVCTYPMVLIERLFDNTVQSCFNGKRQVSRVGPPHVATVRNCVRMSVDVSSNYCGQYDENHPIESRVTLNALTHLPITGYRATSIQVKTVEGHTVAYLGTQTGTLLKVVIHNATSGTVFDELQLNSGRILHRGMTFDRSQMHLNIMTHTKVLQVRISECEGHASCEACHAASDPHCGWCFSKNLCTYSDQCASTDLFSWLPHPDTCPRITQVRPQDIPISALPLRALAVELDRFPVRGASQVQCVLEEAGGEQQVVGGTLISRPTASVPRIQCDRFDTAPELPPSADHVNLTLIIRVGVIRWAVTTVKAFDCAALNSCTACAGSSVPCQWCVRQHVCTTQREGCLSTDIAIIPSMQGGVRPSSSVLVGKESCPQWLLFHSQSRLIAPSSNLRSFTVKAFNLQSFHTDLQCQFRSHGHIIVAPATLKVVSTVANLVNITCDSRVLSYIGEEPYESVPLDVMWDNFPLDNPTNVTVEVYKCRYLATNCGQCLLLPADYLCGWCENGCSLSKDCPTNSWLDRDATCGNPQILTMSPHGGPVKGSTNLTVGGVNLGRRPSDLEGLIFLGDTLCDLIPELYQPSISFTCRTRSATRADNVTLRVSVNNRYNATGPRPYIYADPVVSGFSPQRGPVSGGTRLTIRGSNLDLGNSLVITIDDQPARLIRRGPGAAVVLTPRQMFTFDATIKVSLDNVAESHVSKRYTYSPNPVISRVHPLQSTVSGGNKLTVTGRDLDVVQTPYIKVIIDSTDTRQEPCSRMVSAQMICPTPDLSFYSSAPSPNPARRRRRDWASSTWPKSVQLGFIMDGLDMILENSNLLYYPDPHVYKFTGPDKTREYRKGELILAGENMNVLQSFPAEAAVLVGGSPCTITTVQQAQVTCTPPDKPRNITNSRAYVQVVLGNYRGEVGYLHYSSKGGLSVGGIVAIVLVLVILIVVIILVIIFIKRRRHRAAVKKIKTMPRPDSIPNAYYDREGRRDTGATGSDPEQVPLKSGDTVMLPNEENVPEKANWQELLDRIDNPKIRESVQEVLITKERLEVGDLVGKGHFSCVYSGTLLDLAGENPSKVAVKTLQSTDFDRQAVENFLKEGVIMKNFNHTHVLRLLGVVVGPNDEPMVILPFMANGDLRSYVKDKKKNFTARQLLGLAQQVAEGMAYLSSLNCIHRDLAARNCMIDEVNIVKVADFGLTREIYERDYYSSKDRKAKLPIKWMAIESLEDFHFTTRSDVWSYGVLMWELMTRGVTPYPDVDVFDIRNYLSTGRRLRKPKYCPDNVYKIMLDCWHEIAERRPSFADLVNRLEMLLNPPKKRLPQPEPEAEPQYINITKSDSVEYLKPVSPSEEDVEPVC